MNIYIYITGNLVAETLFIAAKAIFQNIPQIKITLFTTGNLLIDVDLNGFELVVVDPSLAQLEFSPGDLVISGIMWPGTIERKIIQKAKTQGALSIIVLADLGGDSAKFQDNEKKLLPDYICVSDSISFENLVSEGISEKSIVKLGSLYLDTISSDTTSSDITDLFGNTNYRQLAYCSVPNQDDYINWGVDLGYSEVVIAEKLAEICQSNGIKLVVRKHPKEFGSKKYDHLKCDSISIQTHDESHTVDFLNRQSLVVSSYSTSLIVGKKLNVPCLSFQPKCKMPQKKQLFDAINIPIATEDCEASFFIKNNFSLANCGIKDVIFNNGKSVHYFENFIKCLAR